MRILLHIVVLSLTAATVLAGGFQVSDHSARAMGLGGAFVAAPNDASSLYANPSSISFLSGTHLSVGTTIIVPENKFTFATEPGTTSKTQSQVLFPPNFSLTHTFEGGFAIGVSASIPFSVKNEWSPDWPAGRVTTRSDIRVVYVSPTASVKLLRSLSLGLALNAAFARVQTSCRVGFDALAQPDGTQSMTGSGKTSFGYTAGLLFHPDEVWSLGAAYRSRISVAVEQGNVTFEGIPGSESSNYPNSTFSTTMTIPDHISAGIGCRPFKGLYLGGEVQYMYWSALSSMSLAFADPSLQLNPNIEQNIPLHWQNSVTARSGLEVTLGDVSFRGGIAYEQSPVPDQYMRPSIPDANRRVFSGGIGYAVSEDLHLDFGCSFVKFEERSISNSMVEYLPGEFLNGTYVSSLTMIGINMSYSWD